MTPPSGGLSWFFLRCRLAFSGGLWFPASLLAGWRRCRLGFGAVCFWLAVCAVTVSRLPGLLKRTLQKLNITGYTCFFRVQHCRLSAGIQPQR
jgi:hypothetical protein